MPFRSDPTRRDVLKLGAATAVAPFAGLVPRASRRVIVAGGGIGGLCCALRADAARPRRRRARGVRPHGRSRLHPSTGAGRRLVRGRRRRAVHEAGLRALLQYVEEFELPYLYYPRREHMLRWIGGRMYTEEMLRDPRCCRGSASTRARSPSCRVAVSRAAVAVLRAVRRPVRGRVQAVRREARSPRRHDARTSCCRRTGRHHARSRCSAAADRRCRTSGMRPS